MSLGYYVVKFDSNSLKLFGDVNINLTKKFISESDAQKYLNNILTVHKFGKFVIQPYSSK